MTPQDPSLKQLTGKSKKSEILSAYEELVKNLQNNAETAQERKTAMEMRHQKDVLEKASNYPIDTILKSVAELEVAIRKWLGELVGALTQEVDKLKNLHEAVAIEEKYLQAVHQIKVEADTLASMIQAAKEKKKQLDEEYAQYEEDMEKKKMFQKEAWNREQEEYKYELSLKRRKEEAEYEEKCAAKECQLKEREERIIVVEKELQELRKFKEIAEEQLREAIETAQKEAEEKTKRDDQVKAQILAERVAADKHIAELTIESLRKDLTQKEEHIRQLKHELDLANRGVKDIAIKVIESSGRMHEHRSIREPELEKKMKDDHVGV